MSWRADLLAVWAVVVRNALMASRNVFFFFELLFWPIVGVISIGLMTRFLGITPAQASFVLIGTIALSVVNVCQLEVAYAVLMDVWSKSIKHQFLAPIGIRHLTVGSWLVGMVRGGTLFTSASYTPPLTLLLSTKNGFSSLKLGIRLVSHGCTRPRVT